ncbi:MAG: cytochrome P450 [Nostoc sp.]|uniref:cytochrome P450 n=1 Tax=Nostoc sp. TaxID=1180 RepID=UPI002FFD49E7
MPLPNQIKTPAFVQVFQWVTDPMGFLEKVGQQYPDIFSSALTGTNSVYVQHPAAIQELFTNPKKKFALIPNQIVQAIIGDYGLAMLVGEAHKRQRQLLMPALHGDRMRSYGQLIFDLTEQVMSQLPLNQPFTARAVGQEISLQVMLQVVFGLYEGERYQQLKDLIGLMCAPFESPLHSSFFFLPFLQKDLGAWSPWGRYVRVRQQIDELLYAEIAERRAQPDPNRTDVLSLLLEATDQEGEHMTELEIRDQLFTLLFGGHETTATTIAWGLYWAHHVPEVGEKVRQELDSFSASTDFMSIYRLPYLTAFCNETLRIYPAAFISTPRVLLEPVELLGHKLETGTRVLNSVYLTHHREDLYPQPKQFRPERFLERQFSPYEYLPFGGGERRCIGEALSLFETKLVLATILSRYELKLVDEQLELPASRGATTAPASGVKMILTGRRVSQDRTYARTV